MFKNILLKAGVVVAAIVTVLVLGKQRVLSMLAVAIIAAIAGGFAGWFLKPCNNKTEIVERVCTDTLVYQIDTCLYKRDTISVTSKSTVTFTPKSKSEDIVPDKTVVLFGETEKQDTNMTIKHFNNGLVIVDDTVYVSGNRVVKWKRSHQLAVVENTTETVIKDEVILQPPVKEKTVYLPTENTASYIGIAGGTILQSGSKPIYQIGLDYRNPRFNTSLMVNTKLDGGSFNVAIPLIKVKK